MLLKILNFYIDVDIETGKLIKEVFPSCRRILKKSSVKKVFHMEVFEKPFQGKISKNVINLKFGQIKLESLNGKISLYIRKPVYMPEFISSLFIYLIKSKGFARDSFLLHGACVIVEKNACLIPGIADSGKTTLSESICREFSDESYVLNDDLTLVCYNSEDKKFEAYKVPVPEDLDKNGFVFEGPYTINRIVFPGIERRTYMQELDMEDAYSFFMKDNAYIHFKSAKESERKINKYNVFLKKMINQIPVFKISYTPLKDRALIRSLIKGLNKEEISCI